MKSLAADAEPVKVLAPASRTSELRDAGASVAGVRLNGRGLAAADAGNDGRMEIAINTIGGKLVLLRPSGPTGHWLDVALSRFSPGAVVTATLADGRTLSRTVQAGSSYLSSEDPRVHFGLGAATTVARLVVRYPWGGESRLSGVAADRVVTVPVPAPPPVRRPASASYRIAGCTPAAPAGSVATLWDETAVDVLGAGNASEPVQARNLFDMSAAMSDAYAATRSPVAISYAAYRLLLWRASFDANLGRTFGLLTARMRSLCLSPDYATTTDATPAAAGNRIGAAAIAAGRRDGSHEALHYADPSYVPRNQPLIVGVPGSTVEDATFWQPLALGADRAAGRRRGAREGAELRRRRVGRACARSRPGRRRSTPDRRSSASRPGGRTSRPRSPSSARPRARARLCAGRRRSAGIASRPRPPPATSRATSASTSRSTAP